jgi:radical SAM protein with 4Fe4S-binding SPASM domain
MDIDRYEYNANKLLSVLVEVTTFCNMECSYCIRTVKDDNNKWRNQHIKLEDFKYIVDSLPPAEEIVTQGVGEPTMHPYLPEIIKIAAESKKFPNITLTTNAMLRNEAYYRSLFEAGLTKLYISVDSLDQELADKMRAGTSVARLKNMISVLSESLSGKIAIRTTVGKNNINTIPALLHDLNSLGSLDVYMHPYDDIGNPTGCLSKERSGRFHSDIALMAEPYLNLHVVANSFIPSPNVCIHPWRIPAITADGYLVPCCRTMDKDIYTFGNIVSNSFLRVWNSEKTNQMRKELVSRSPSFCSGCPRYVERS